MSDLEKVKKFTLKNRSQRSVNLEIEPWSLAKEELKKTEEWFEGFEKRQKFLATALTTESGSLYDWLKENGFPLDDMHIRILRAFIEKEILGEI